MDLLIRIYQTLLMYCYMTKCINDSYCSDRHVPTFNLVEIALRQLFQICYETKAVVGLLCLGITTSLSALLGLKLAYFLQELRLNYM